MNRLQNSNPNPQFRFTARIFKEGKWWVGFFEEVPGAITQAATREELIENLQSVLQEVLEVLREEAAKQVKGKGSEEIVFA